MAHWAVQIPQSKPLLKSPESPVPTLTRLILIFLGLFGIVYGIAFGLQHVETDKNPSHHPSDTR